MDASMYCGILKANLRPSTKKLRMGNDFVIQHDSNPKHDAKKTKLYKLPQCFGMAIVVF